MSSWTSSPMPKLSSCGEPWFCTFISILYSILCYWSCSLLASRSLNIRGRFPAIPQSQSLIEDASVKKFRTLYAVSYLISAITTRWGSTYPLSPNPNPSQQHICRPLALTEVTNLIFEVFGTCFVVLCTFSLAIEQLGWWAEPEFREVQSDTDHILQPLTDITTNTSRTD